MIKIESQQILVGEMAIPEDERGVRPLFRSKLHFSEGLRRRSEWIVHKGSLGDIRSEYAHEYVVFARNDVSARYSFFVTHDFYVDYVS